MTGAENKKKEPGRLDAILGPTFSPHGLLTRAVIITLAYFVAHLAGLRAYTTIICGTSPTGNPADTWAAVLGVIYVLLYLGFVVLVPVLVIAALLFAGWACLAARAARPPGTPPEGPAD